MILIGAAFAMAAATAMCLAARRGSAVQRRLALLEPAIRVGIRWRPVDERDLRHAGLARTHSELVGAKILFAALGVGLGWVGGAFLGVGPIGAIVGAYTGFVLPSLAIERRAAAKRRDADRALGPFLERLEALTASGRPVESACVALAGLPTSAAILDGALTRASAAYALGAPLFASLAAEARAEGLPRLAGLATALDRARDLGHGSAAVIRDARDAARAAERAESLAAAATVEGKLMLTLVLCYLPALMLLVVVPLFMTLLDGLFG